MLVCGPDFLEFSGPGPAQAWARVGPQISGPSPTRENDERARTNVHYGTYSATKFGGKVKYSGLGILGTFRVGPGFGKKSGPKPRHEEASCKGLAVRVHD
jgi:hypothetical protein